MTFLTASLDWFLGKRSAHMGPSQYVAHAGKRDGHSTSGALLWAESEAETLSASGNMVNAETSLLQQVIGDINNYVPSDTTVIDLGPGTAIAFRNKTLPLVQHLGSKLCVLVDESAAFLKQISETHTTKSVSIRPIIDDFFENDMPYVQEQAVVCSFGSTISNCIGQLSDELPQDTISDGLHHMAQAANGGWLLVGFDSDHDGERIKNFYKAQGIFQLNIFDRMQVELLISGDFDPTAFLYEPEWCGISGQLAHIAVVSRDMDFKLNGVPISLKQGQKLHIKNSYKLTPGFFEKCCRSAGLQIIQKWSNDSPAKIYLMRIAPKKLHLPTSKPETLLRTA